LKHISLLILLGLHSFALSATHLRGGEITVQQDSTNSLSFQAILVVYSHPGSVGDLDSAVINWGDGTLVNVARSTFEIISMNVQKNIFLGSHTYSDVPPDSVVLVSYTGSNRIAGINNINAGNSVDIPMYFHTALNLKQLQFTTGNSTARFLSEIPIDAYVTIPLHHNLQPFDADGDSYLIDTYVPMEDSQSTVTNYLMPDAFSGTYDINAGLVDWVTPMFLGQLSVGFRIHEFRDGKWLSTTFRDAFISVNVPSGIETETFHAIKVYPNPAHDFVSIDTHDARYTKMLICNAVGESVCEAPVANSRTIVDLSSFRPGYYFVKILGGDKMHVLPLVVQ
jgi:hypothetical protein